MKKISLTLVGLILLFNLATAIDTEFPLACLGPGGNVPLKSAVFEKQVKPINQAFGLNADLSELEKTASNNTAGFYTQNILATKLSTSMPRTGMEYEVIRNGKTLNSQSTTIQQGDIIRFKPATSIGSDWIVQGATVDSPPVTLLNSSKFNQLYETLYQRFLNKYPASNWDKIVKLTPESLPEFTTETTPFNNTGNYYTADNGYRAYLVPFIGGQKAGVQIFYAPNPNTENANCKTAGNAIECKITKSQNLQLSLTGKTFVHVDKIIHNSKAVNAGWTTAYGESANRQVGDITTNNPWQYAWRAQPPVDLEIQVLPPGKQAPIADFDCKVSEEKYSGLQQKFLKCDASKSRDPDGTIVKYNWKTNNTNKPCQGTTPGGPTCKVPRLSSSLAPSSITLTLKVTDNDGYYDTKTKTFNIAHMPVYNPDSQTPAKPAQEPITELTAEYNPQTRMAEVTAKCDSQKINISINNAITGSSVLEKQPIKCGQTTPIGPIKIKGAYKVSAASNPEITPAVFTVD